MKLILVPVVISDSVLSRKPELFYDERADGFAGCYNLQLGRWTRLGFFPATPAVYQIPSVAFQLDRTPVDHRDPHRLQIRPNMLIDGTATRLDGWTLAPDGSAAVYITWTDGFTGVSLHLKPERARKRLEGGRRYGLHRPRFVAISVGSRGSGPRRVRKHTATKVIAAA